MSIYSLVWQIVLAYLADCRHTELEQSGSNACMTYAAGLNSLADMINFDKQQHYAQKPCLFHSSTSTSRRPGLILLPWYTIQYYLYPFTTAYVFRLRRDDQLLLPPLFSLLPSLFMSLLCSYCCYGALMAYAYRCARRLPVIFSLAIL